MKTVTVASQQNDTEVQEVKLPDTESKAGSAEKEIVKKRKYTKRKAKMEKKAKKGRRGRPKGSKSKVKKVTKRRYRRMARKSAVTETRYAVITEVPTTFVKGEILIVNSLNKEISGKGRKLKNSEASFEMFDTLEEACQKIKTLS